DERRPGPGSGRRTRQVPRWLAASCVGATRRARPSDAGTRAVPSWWQATKGPTMAESVYKIIELVGTSEESWEKAASAAVARAAGSLRDLRVAEVAELDLQIEGGEVKAYRAKVKVSFKYEGGD